MAEGKPALIVKREPTKLEKAVQVLALIVGVLSAGYWFHVDQERQRLQKAVDSLRAEQATFKRQIIEEQRFTQTNEQVVNRKIEGLAGEWRGGGYKDPSVLLNKFIEDVRTETRATALPCRAKKIVL